MLQRMRDGIQGWISWVIIIAIIASLGLLGVNYYSHGTKNNNDVAATVNGTDITQQQVDIAYNRFRQQQADFPSNVEAQQKLRQDILQKLIDQTLFKNIATANHFTVSQQQVNSMIVQIPAFQQNGQFSPALFSAVLNQLGYSQQQLFSELETDILISQLQNGIAASAFTLPAEVDTMINILQQTRDFSYATISNNQYLSKITVDPKEVQAYYQAHLAEFQTPEKVQVDYLKISAQDIISSIKPTDAQLQQFYQANLSNYSQPAQWQIAHIVVNITGTDATSAKNKLAKIQAALKAGSPFAEVAKDFSEDPLSAKKGGVLPWVSEGTLPSIIQNAIVNLKVGQVSLPILNQNSYEIVKLLKTKPLTTQPFAQVKNTVKQAYVQQAAQKQFADMTQQLQDLSFQNPDALTVAAQTLHLPIQTSDWLLRNNTAKGLFANAQLLQAAFSDLVRTGNNSDVLYPDPSTAVVVHVKNYQAAQQIPFTEVSSAINTLLLQNASQAQAELTAGKIADELNDGKTLAQVTSEYGVKWTSVKNLSSHDQKVNSLILQTAFNVPRPVREHPISASIVSLPTNQVAIVAITAVHDSTKKILPAERNIYQTQLQNNFGQFTLTELLAHYRKQANVKVLQAKFQAAD